MKLLKWIKNALEHLTEEPSAPIVEEPASEKITMATTTEDIVAHVRGWSLDRAADMSIDKEDARAILAEFYEWIEPEDNELEIMSMEPEG
jgi:hypothetical protein